MPPTWRPRGGPETDLSYWGRTGGAVEPNEVSDWPYENWVVQHAELFKFNWSQALIGSVIDSGLHIFSHPSLKAWRPGMDADGDRSENGCWHHLRSIRVRGSSRMSQPGNENSNPQRWLWRWGKPRQLQIPGALQERSRSLSLNLVTHFVLVSASVDIASFVRRSLHCLSSIPRVRWSFITQIPNSNFPKWSLGIQTSNEVDCSRLLYSNPQLCRSFSLLISVAPESSVEWENGICWIPKFSSCRPFNLLIRIQISFLNRPKPEWAEDCPKVDAVEISRYPFAQLDEADLLALFVCPSDHSKTSILKLAQVGSRVVDFKWISINVELKFPRRSETRWRSIIRPLGSRSEQPALDRWWTGMFWTFDVS